MLPEILVAHIIILVEGGKLMRRRRRYGRRRFKRIGRRYRASRGGIRF